MAASLNDDISYQALSCLSTFGFRIFVHTVTHPLEYAKVLIQIGHEPLPPYPTKSLFGKRAYALPNVFRYVKYIKAVDGFSGCYRGYFPRITAQVIGTLTLDTTIKKLKARRNGEHFSPNEEEMTDDEKRSYFIQNLKINIIGRTVSIIANQPFLVIAVRMMAQFVGGEEKYSGVISSIKEIYREQGILGFFAGIVPRWIGEITTLVLSSTVTFVVSSYLIQDKDLKTFTSATIQYITSAFTYPFNVVTSCMEVNNCGLAAGLPPNMPIFHNWRECWSHLARNSQLNRGSSLLWRYYFGPKTAFGDAAFIKTN